MTQLEAAQKRIEYLEGERNDWRDRAYEASSEVANLTAQVKVMRKALELSEQYLTKRGIRTAGVEGRTIVLPAIDEALSQCGKP